MVVELSLLTFAVLIVLGMPVVFAMGLASIWAVLLRDNVPWNVLLHRTFVGIDSWVLLAVPLFILAGMLMEQGGIGQPLMRLAIALVGWLRGGIGMATVVSEMFFSGISGSTVADVAAMTALTMPLVRRSGYKPEQFVAIRCAAAAMGILIPPCILMVLFAEVAHTSIAALFMAGFLPATVMALLLMMTIYVQATRLGLQSAANFSVSEAGSAFKGSLWAMGMPILIFAGILGGWYTATEAAAIAVIYALVVGVAVYRQISATMLWRMLGETARMTGVVMLLIGFANIFTYILALEGLTQMVRTVLAPVLYHYIPFMIVLCIVFIILSSVIEPLPAGLILIPLLWPVAKDLGMNVLHFVNVLVMAGGIGLFLPPAGVGLVVGCAMAKVQVGRVLPSFMIFLAVLLLGLLVLIAIPPITTVVPDVLGMRY
ncbi:MAG: TRAP transporter large permease [Chloroflexi bacterium]|nr:TRAP transporter large permease [Chloroflexota bacterium]MBI4506153.1 TRAP transporter large permease [Chloroflexota bacterium]